VGPASAHLVLAIEEAVKARVFYQRATLSQGMTARELRDLLYTHPVRHGIAFTIPYRNRCEGKSNLWQVDHPGKDIDRKSLARLFARHADALPFSWARTADRDKRRGMHVDWNGRGWKTPAASPRPISTATAQIS